MSHLLTKKLGAISSRTVQRIQPTRNVYGRSRIGCRDVVGYGHNGSYVYKDDSMYPFPAIRFRENTADVIALRQREKCDWKQLCYEEKKALYRISFCQTFAEFKAPTGQWKFVLGGLFLTTSFPFWMYMFLKFYVYGPLPDSFSKVSQQAQLRRIIDARMNPIDGLCSKYDYERDMWKVK